MAIDFYNKNNKEPPVNKYGNLSADEVKSIINYAVNTGLVDNKFMNAVASTSNRMTTSSNNYKIKLSESLEAYVYMLDNVCTVDEAIKVSLSTFDYDEITLDEFIKLTGNKNIYNINSNVVKCKEHPIQKGMVKEGVLHVKSLKRCKTIKSQLEALRHSLLSYEKLLELRNNLSKERTNSIIRDIKVSSIVEAQEQLHSMMKELTYDISTTKGKKELASILKNRGYTQKHIAEVIGNKVLTIKRWWKDL